MLGGRQDVQLAKLETEVGRLRGLVAGLEERLTAKDEIIAELKATLGRREARIETLHADIIDLARVRAIPSATDKPAAPRPQHATSSGNGNGNGDHEPPPRRLSRADRVRRQQDRELVEFRQITPEAFAARWGPLEDEEAPIPD